MSRKKKKSTDKEEQMLKSLSEPWIQKRTGFIAITVLSVVLMIFIAVQMIIQNPEEWPKGLLWGFLFGASIWIVFLGFNWFHSLFRPKPKNEEE